MMRDDSVLAAILPEGTRFDRFNATLPLAAADDAILRLAALVDIDRTSAKTVAGRLRLSNAEGKRLEGLAAPWPLDPAGDDKAQKLAIYRLGAERFGDLVLLSAADGRLKPAALRRLADPGLPAPRRRRDRTRHTAGSTGRSPAHCGPPLVGRARVRRRPRRLPRAARANRRKADGQRAGKGLIMGTPNRSKSRTLRVT